MSRYIDREDLLKNLKQFAPEHLTPLIVSLIEKQPTADVVEVIRCKDCKHYHQFTSFCEKNSYFYDDNGLSCSPADSPCWTMFADNDFCSYGERMDGETSETSEK